ncbi:MAG: ROK family protein [bacterium]
MKSFFAGIDLGGTKILTVVADEKKNIVAKIKIATEAEKGVEHVVENMIKSLEMCCSEAQIELAHLEAAGIGVPGPVNFKKGIVYDCPNLKGWKNIKIAEIFKQKTGIKAVVENDARVAGLAETRCGAAKGYRHVFYVTVSTGIGGALIFDGKIYRGADGGAGEFGQMKLLDGTIFEQSYAGPAIERKFGVPTSKLSELIKKNDPGAKAALKHLTDGLGIYFANVVTLLNPEIVVVGGGVSSLGSLLLEPIEKKIRKHSFSISSKNVKIVQAGLGTDSGAIGAIELLFPL